jgi:outer membrane lipoprotein-sorting protein
MNKYTVHIFSTRIRILSLAIFFGLFLSLSSCKNQKKITLNNGKCILDFKNARTLTTNLKANEFKFDRLKARLSIDALIDSSSNSFTVALRIKKDSVIWMSLSKLGIEGARILITKDSVKFVNPIKSQYFTGDFAYLSKLLNTELDFEIIQSLLIGNSVTFYDETEKIKPGVDNCQYTLGTIRKFKLRKVMEKGKELKEGAQSIYMIPETFKIARILFYDFNPDRSFDAQFGAFATAENSNNQLFPFKMNYVIKAQKNVTIDIEYNKIQLNEELSFPFKIQDNYERIHTEK